MDKNDIKHNGITCLHFRTSRLSLLATTSIGPRILSLTANGGENLFAELPDTILPYPGGQDYHLWGGHRLWHSPESSRRTYIPDELPVQVQETEHGVILTQPEENPTKLQKAIKLTIPDEDKPVVIVDHMLTNMGLWPVKLAPWAITVMKPGGFAILPLYNKILDAEGLLPNRKLILWPYSNLKLKNLDWKTDAIFLHSPLQEGAFKIGFPNLRGWLAYYQSPYLFVKRSVYKPDVEYPDDGCSSECYLNPMFLELETLGPLESIEPGNTVTHREIWEIQHFPDFIPNEAWLASMDAPIK